MCCSEMLCDHVMPLLSCVGGRRLPARKGNIVNIPRTRHRIYRAALYTRHSIAGGNACGATHRETCEILRRPHSARRRVSERARCHANLLAAAAFEALQHPTTFLCETSVSRPSVRPSVCLSYLDRNSPGRRLISARRARAYGQVRERGRGRREIAEDWRLPFPVLNERVAASLFSNRRAFPSFPPPSLLPSVHFLAHITAELATFTSTLRRCRHRHPLPPVSPPFPWKG